MFKAELKADTLKGLVNVISTLIDEVKFTITPEGMNLKAVDAAHVAMVEIQVGKDAFESYEADECEIGLDLDKVKGVLKLALGSDVISMEQDDTLGRLVFKVGNITRRMSLVDTAGMGDVKVPQLTLSTEISLEVDELQRGMRAADTISDHLTLSAGPEYFEVSCMGDTDSVSLKLDKDSLKSISAEGEVRSMFPHDYFANIVRAIPSGTVVTVELDTDYPVKLVFGLAEGRVKVSYMLAPRIESD